MELFKIKYFIPITFFVVVRLDRGAFSTTVLVCVCVCVCACVRACVGGGGGGGGG